MDGLFVLLRGKSVPPSVFSRKAAKDAKESAKFFLMPRLLWWTLVANDMTDFPQLATKYRK